MLNSPWTPLVLSLVYLGVTGARMVWLRRTAGTSGYVIDHGDATHRFVAGVFFVVIAGMLAYFVAAALWPSFEGAAGLIAWASGEPMRAASLALMGFATVWTGYAQFSMGTSWRIGIPQGPAPALRTGGPFALSRNPIFLGMLLFVLALTLWSPSAPTLAFLVAAYIALEVQIRGEEGWLEAQHGEAYRAYRARVRRWI